jgi:hypothetical protein
MDSTGTTKEPVPTLFGMNFQAVSVGQKLPKSGPGDDTGLVGGYADALGTRNSALAKQLDYVDGALGEIIGALKTNNLLDSTLIVIASKHGQAPIDPATFQPLDDAPYAKAPGYAFHIADDASLIYLDSRTRPVNLDSAQKYLDANVKLLGIGKLWTANEMALVYADPGDGQPHTGLHGHGKSRRRLYLRQEDRRTRRSQSRRPERGSVG